MKKYLKKIALFLTFIMIFSCLQGSYFVSATSGLYPLPPIEDDGYTEIETGCQVSGSLTFTKNKDTYIFEPTVSGLYIIAAPYVTGKCISLYDSSSNLLGSNHNYTSYYCNLSICCFLHANETYNILVTGSSMGSYNLIVNYATPNPTGSFEKSFNNSSIASCGMNMNFGLIYNSQDYSDHTFGNGWTFSYEGSIKNYIYSYKDTNGYTKNVTLSNIKIVKLPGENAIAFQYINGLYKASYSKDTLVQNTDGSFTLTTPDKQNYIFNTSGYLVSIIDKNDNKISINVDSSGKINSVTDTVGRVYTLNYSSNAITLTDPMNRTITYNYANNNLTSIIDPLGNVIDQLSYDSTVLGSLSTIKDGSNKIIDSISYDHTNNKSRMVSETDENNNTYKYTYNGFDNEVISTDNNNKEAITWYNDADQITCEQDENGYKTYYIYNDTGDLLKQISPKNGTDVYTNTADQSLFNITSYQYDANGNVINTTYPDGTAEVSNYDNNNNLLTQKDKDNTTTYYEYDSKGNIILKAVRKSGTDDYSDNLTDSQKQNFEITQYSYNSNGTINYETDPDGTVTTYSNYINGSPQTVSNSSTGTTTYTYNILGWITSETTPDGKVTSNDYNNDGVVIRTKVGTDVTRFIYNTNGNLVQEIDPAQYDPTKDGLNNNPATDTYSDSNAGIRYSYDAHNNVISKIDAKNNTINSSYDDHNKIVKSVYNNTDVTRFIYNADGKLIQQINPDQYDATKDGWVGTSPVNTYSDSSAGNRFAYDADGNIQTETYPNGQVFNYDSSGKVTSVANNATGAAVSEIGYIYDTNGNILTISENGTQKVKYYYDIDDQLVREDNVWQNQTITYTYDNSGNILSKFVYNYTTADEIIDAPSYVYSYSYTDSTDKNKLTSYDGKNISYDSNGNMTNFNGWTYSWSGKNLSASTNGKTNVSYQYNSDGIRTQKIVNGITTTYTLNGDNNITSETNGIDTINYFRDISGNLLSMMLNGTKYLYERNSQGDIIGLLDSSNNEVVTYSYDSWGNLINISGSLASTVGAKNPFRYRSYYYDSETGLYYLQARYYNPGISRFISKDNQGYHEGLSGAASNIYAYANNNPVMNIDPNGHSTLDTLIDVFDIIVCFVSFVYPAKIPIIIANLSLGAWSLGWAVYYLYRDYSRYRGKLRTVHVVIDAVNIVMGVLSTIAGCIGIRLRVLKSMGLIGKWQVVSITCDFLSGMFGIPWSATSAVCSGLNVRF